MLFQTVLVTIDFYCMDKKHWDIVQNVFLCFTEEKKSRNDMKVVKLKLLFIL